MEDAEAIVRAIETNLEGFLLAFCRVPASHTLRSPEYTQVVTPGPIGMFNLVLSTALPSDQAASRIADITERFSSRGVAACWWITPSSLPENLEALLERSGWSLSNAWAGMARELEATEVTGVGVADPEVSCACSEAEVDEWLDVFRRGFGVTDRLWRALGEAWRGRPLPFALWVARRNGEALGTALVHRTGVVAGIYCVSTLPEARRTGVATGMMHALMQDAYRQGCRLAIVQSTEMGRSLYLRLGFQEMGRFRMFDRSP